MAKKTLLSACTMDCPDACSLAVEVEDGKVVNIAASNLNPTTQGFICTKVARFARRLYADERVRYPLQRVGPKGSGRFGRISWHKAIDEICTRLTAVREEWGGEAILPFYYGGSNGLLGQETVDHAFFARLGASRLALTVCAAPTTEVAKAMYGKMPGAAFEDYAYARLIIVWGANPKASNIHLMPFLKQAKKAGAKIVTVDPVRNFSEAETDLHLPVYPGTDVLLALAMIRFWRDRDLLDREFIAAHTKGIGTLLQACDSYTIEKASKITRVESWKIEKLAKMYAFHDPALLRIGWGQERNYNGGASTAAILAMPAVLGKFGRRGSGYTLSNSAAYKVDARIRTEEQPWNTRVINMNHLGKALLEENDPPVKALFVYNCNPAVTIPNQKAVLGGLARDDLFTVVSEQVMTDTAQFADIILPAVTFLEQHEIKNGYGSYASQYLSPVVAPEGEARPNEEMFAALGRAMGWGDKAFTETTDDYLRRAAKAINGFGNEVTFDDLSDRRIKFFDNYKPTPVQFNNVFPWTPDGKVNLAPEPYGLAFYEYVELQDEDHPLVLISPATDKTISSTLGEFNLPELTVNLHPDDAARRNLKKGDEVRVFNAMGEVVVRLQIDPRLRPGVAVMAKGAWRKASRNGMTATALSPDTLSPIGKGACFNDARVQVSKA